MRATRSVAVVITAGCLIALLSLGGRSVFGVFMEPMIATRGWTREMFGLAMAWQNLFWGVGALLAGVVADRHGSVRVMLTGGLIYAAGVIGMSMVTSPWLLYLTGGVMVGLGIALTSFAIALSAMARVVGPSRRPLVLGLGTAAGSVGQVLFSPLCHLGIAQFGWPVALYGVAAVVMLIIPLAVLMPGPAESGTGHEPGAEADAGDDGFAALAAACLEALQHRGYLLLTAGFFVCGFHVAFVTVHFPAYVREIGLSAGAGAWAIAVIGLFNIVGSLLAGVIGQRWSEPYALALIYALRAVTVGVFLLSPVSTASVFLFSAMLGLLWLSTVPLTTGIVARVFGVEFLATLFGIVFLSHQLGSFLGVWLGGLLHDITGSYDLMWWTGVGLSLIATLLHWPIDARPLPRLAAAPTAP